jgi:hypothetical protein
MFTKSPLFVLVAVAVVSGLPMAVAVVQVAICGGETAFQ